MLFPAIEKKRYFGENRGDQDRASVNRYVTHIENSSLIEWNKSYLDIVFGVYFLPLLNSFLNPDYV